MKETPQERQAIIDSINQRLGTSPKFNKKEEDYFSHINALKIKLS